MLKTPVDVGVGARLKKEKAPSLTERDEVRVNHQIAELQRDKQQLEKEVRRLRIREIRHLREDVRWLEDRASWQAQELVKIRTLYASAISFSWVSLRPDRNRRLRGQLCDLRPSGGTEDDRNSGPGRPHHRGGRARIQLLSGHTPLPRGDGSPRRGHAAAAESTAARMRKVDPLPRYAGRWMSGTRESSSTGLTRWWSNPAARDRRRSSSWP